VMLTKAAEVAGSAERKPAKPEIPRFSPLNA
jgi:hypothetical protein